MTDAGRFDALLRSAARPGKTADQKTALLAEAAGLYLQPLLPGFYETWALTERDRYAEAHWRALRELSELHEQAGRRGEAMAWARRAVSADPLREEAHAQVIRLLTASGQTAGARRQFAELHQILEAELGVTPSPETRALLEQAPSAFVFAPPPTGVETRVATSPKLGDARDGVAPLEDDARYAAAPMQGGMSDGDGSEDGDAPPESGVGSQALAFAAHADAVLWTDSGARGSVRPAAVGNAVGDA